MTSPTLRPAQPADLEAIHSLLMGENLPIDGVESHLDTFLVLAQDDHLIGCVGLEVYGTQALLRSLAVSPTHRGRGWGRTLTEAVIHKAAALDVTRVALLTITAESFFERHGFTRIPREDVDPRVWTSVEFTSCCPCSAACMRRDIEN